jgi:hypothetical protein
MAHEYKRCFTGERDAVLSNTGQPVHQSGPGLTGPTLSLTAGRKPEARPPVQPKTGRGVGQSPMGCEAALSPLFNPLEINRNKSKRGKHCGCYSVRGLDPKTQTTTFQRINCKCWGCCYCGPRKAKRYKRAIREIAERLNLRRFVTLTLDPSKIHGDPVCYLNKTFAKLRTYLKRYFGRTPWQAVGGGLYVNIEFVDVQRVSRYLSKYLTKELLLSAPLRSRRVTTSRGIHLFEKQDSETKWSFIDRPISILYKLHIHCLQTIELDEESVLKSFSIKSGDDRLEKG